MREITKGIKEMAKLGFTLTGNGISEYLVRKFVKHDENGTISEVITYYYIEEIGVQVFANDVKRGKGSKIDTDLLNAIKLNFDELKHEYKKEEE